MEKIENLTGARIRHRKMSVKLRQKIETSLLSTTYFLAFISGSNSGLGWFIFVNSAPLMEDEKVAESEKLKQFLLKNGILFEFFESVDGVVLD